MQKPADLNDAQWRSVQHDGGHLLIIAGPGTGKTHTLIRRIVHLAGQLKTGEKVLAITFTNKAAREMQERLTACDAQFRNSITVGTFHSFCLALFAAIHEAHQSPSGFPHRFSGRNRTASQILLNLPAKEMKDAIEAVSHWKSFTFNASKPARLKEYNELLRSKGLADFDDLI